ncbi:hypothetical protein [Paracoccus sp. (in: a-proteobacteria)]|uniref:hypothetical protein n=1 Tax=Paracoccus sp. TaxID=267 RepID=UPI002AFF64C8|nr:hypothetical protein [Paracoccus sp. (in: a-proteobacteria)]
MLVFWQVFQLIFGPTGDGVNVARFIAHEVEIADRDSHGFGANAKEPTDIDYSLRICSVAMYMLNGADAFIVGSIDGGSGKMHRESALGESAGSLYRQVSPSEHLG